MSYLLMFDDNAKLLELLEKQGNDLLSDPNLIHQPKQQINATKEQMLTLLHDIKKIESEKVITGLLINLSSYIDSESADQFWIDLIIACQHVTNYLEIYGIMETLRALTYLEGEVNKIFLEFLTDPAIPNDQVRPYAIETLYDYLPHDFFTINQDRKFFLAELVISSFLEGDIYHRSFLIQILFALHFNSDELISITSLHENFWKIAFDISLEQDNFSQLFKPFRKLKFIAPDFFEQENTIISENLLNFQTSVENSNPESIPIMLNLFKFFYLFPTNEIIDFLKNSHDAFVKFTNEQWSDIKSISHLIYEAVDDARFTEGQVKEIYEFSGTLPDTSGKFFIFVHFIEIFQEICNFIDPFIQSLCQEWMKSDDFNPVIYCYCISQISRDLDPKSELFNEVIVPSIFSFIEAEDNPLLNYEALKALNHLYREDLIKAANFYNTLFELTLKANPKSYRSFFKIIQEIEKHTRNESDDESDYDDEEKPEEDTENETKQEKTEEKPIKVPNKQIHEKIEEFVRSTFTQEDVNPCLLGYLCDMLIYFITDEESDDFIEHCATVCNRLITEPIPTENPTILIQVESLVLSILRNSNPEKGEFYFTLFNPVYEFLFNLVSKFNYDPEEGSEVDPEYHRIIGNVAYLLSYISKKAKKMSLSFEFPLTIISNILDSKFIDLIKFGIHTTIKQIPSFYTPEENPHAEMIITVLQKIINIAETTDSYRALNMCFQVFIAIFKKYPKLEELEPISQFIEQIKSIVFEERMKLLNNQSIFRFEGIDIKHFAFFEFLSKLIDNNYILTPVEILILIRWSENISKCFIQDLALTFFSIIKSGQLARSPFLLDNLWKALNEMLERFSSNFEEEHKTVMPILNSIAEFLVFTTANELGTYNCSKLFHNLQFFLKSDSNDKCTNTSIDTIKYLGPIYMKVYSVVGNINNINFAILRIIFDTMIEHRIKSWNYADMIFEAILIYQSLTTFHICNDVGADLLFTFYRNRGILRGFPEDLMDKIRETLNDMQSRERVVRFLLSKYKEQPSFRQDIDDAFDLTDEDDFIYEKVEEEEEENENKEENKNEYEDENSNE